MGLIITGILRVLQILCAAVVLGLSITLIKKQEFGSVAAINYAAFTGGWGLLVALVGVAAMFVEPLSGLIMAAVDALAALFFLAGGIAIAVKLRHVSCSSKSSSNLAKLVLNSLTNGGCATNNKGDKVACGADSTSFLLNRCKENSADSAFMIIAAVVGLGLVGLALFTMRKGRGRRGGVVV